jgi:hypothetical protein
MLKKSLIFIFIILVAVIAAYKGIPFLKELKNRPADTGLVTGPSSNISITGGRVIDMDMSVEDICVDFISNDTYARCASAPACDSMCKSEGCQYFGLEYVGSDFSQGKCICKCFEENKIKKALSP